MRKKSCMPNRGTKMQLLYGNDGMNYHTIAKSSEMTPAQEKELLKDYLRYDFVSDDSIYSSLDAEPVAITCVTTDFSHTLPEKKLLVIHSARMTEYLTPSYYAHFELTTPAQDSYGEKFFQILQKSYIKDREVMEYAAKSIDSFQSIPEKSAEFPKDALPKEQRLALVAAVMQTTASISGQIWLMIDEEGDKYNRRASEVIAAIYSCLPYGIRQIAGFSTYAVVGKAVSARVKLQLCSREEKNSSSGKVWDLKDLDCEKILAEIPDRVVKMARVLVEQPEVRTEWFAEFQEAFGNQEVSLEEHLTFYENVSRWREAELGTIFDEISMYAWQEQNKKFSKSEKTVIFELFCNIMSERFEKENYIAVYQEIIYRCLKKQKSPAFDKRTQAYLALGEALSCIQQKEEVFQEWEQDRLKELLEQYEDLERIQKLAEMLQSFQQYRLQYGKLQEIWNRMEQVIQDQMQKTKQEILENVRKAQQAIREYFQRQKWSGEDSQAILEYGDSIKYPKVNDKFFRTEFTQAYESYLEQRKCFRNYAEFQTYICFTEQCKSKFPEEEYTKLRRQLEEKGDVVIQMEKERRLVWKRRRDVLDAYRSLAKIEILAEKNEVDIPMYIVTVGQKEYDLETQELISAVRFICVPDEVTEKEFLYCITNQPEFVDSLKKEGLFPKEYMKKERAIHEWQDADDSTWKNDDEWEEMITRKQKAQSTYRTEQKRTIQHNQNKKKKKRILWSRVVIVGVVLLVLTAAALAIYLIVR